MSQSSSEQILQIGQHVPLRIGPSPLHGLGVFAVEPIAEDEVVEVAPVLYIPEPEAEHVARTMLREYYFQWEEGVAVALGYGSVYNHSYTPNATYMPWPLRGYPHGVFVLAALGPIAAGEEITFNYAGGSRGRQDLWFTPNL